MRRDERAELKNIRSTTSNVSNIKNRNEVVVEDLKTDTRDQELKETKFMKENMEK